MVTSTRKEPRINHDYKNGTIKFHLKLIFKVSLDCGAGNLRKCNYGLIKKKTPKSGTIDAEDLIKCSSIVNQPLIIHSQPYFQSTILVQIYLSYARRILAYTGSTNTTHETKWLVEPNACMITASVSYVHEAHALTVHVQGLE
jgi:hypothetical protein